MTAPGASERITAIRARGGRVVVIDPRRTETAALAEAYPPERVATATGIAAEQIREIARDFANAPTAAAYGRVGVAMQEFGRLATWLITALNLTCGRSHSGRPPWSAALSYFTGTSTP